MNFKKPKHSVEKLKAFFESKSEKPLSSSHSKKLSASVLWYLNQGLLRVWDSEEKKVNTWVKQSILDFFPSASLLSMNAGVFQYLDKLPLKSRTTLKGVRVVPGAIVRYGSFVEKGAILMPSFINVGAYVGARTMVDTWATVGSCAQVGEDVHLSGGVGIGGVLEPAQARPVIIGNGAFLGSRAIVVEGVEVGARAVLGAGVVITATTKIFDLTQNGKQIASGFIPENAVVVSGTVPKKVGELEFGMPCALILGHRKESTDLKTSLNSALRDHGVSV